MTNLLLLVAGFLLGASAFGFLALLMLAHRRPPPPTFYHRRSRDAPVADVVATDERNDGINYRFMCTTGLEE